MDVVQKLICRKLGGDDDYQSVLNVQKRQGAPCRAVKNKHNKLPQVVLAIDYLLFVAMEGSTFVII